MSEEKQQQLVKEDVKQGKKKDSQIRSGEGKKEIRPKNEKHSKVG